MQLYALDEQKRPVFVQHALRQHNYACMECHQAVRVRGGLHRHAHFYHLALTQSCRLNGKSMAHLQVQYALQQLLPPGECRLECPFTSINRIADVVWISQKLVFEIQCSSITATEIEQRNRDYRSMGFQTVWILHDKRFNQWRLTAAELALMQTPTYFTNMDKEGVGIIYDQGAIVERAVRHLQLKPLPVDLSQLLRHPAKIAPTIKAPKMLLQRIKQWPLYFSGDLLDHYFKNCSDIQEILQQALKAEELLESHSRKVLGWKAWLLRQLSHYVLRPYRLCFQALLENSCK